MPELPEVEAAARRLRAAIRGDRLARVRAIHPSAARALRASVERAMRGRAIVEVRRVGKYQLIELEGDARIVAHFRLDGDWEIVVAGAALPRYTRATIETDGGVRIALVDPRALSTLTIHCGAGAGVPDVGPDPTARSMTPAMLMDRLRGRRIGIKQALMEQRIIAGVGNIYAAEALWRARISPDTPAGRIGPARAARLLSALRAVLRRGDPRARPEGGAALRVYGREGRPCPRCGRKIRRVVSAGRGTFYCPGCQR